MTTDQRQYILESLEPLFAEAERDGLWFFSQYQCFWLSPKELREYHCRGEFVWGPDNWILRNPREGLKKRQRDVEEAQIALEQFKQRLAESGVQIANEQREAGR